MKYILLIKYMKSVLWRASKRLSYIEDARFLKVHRMMFNMPVYGADQYSPPTFLYTFIYKYSQ